MCSQTHFSAGDKIPRSFDLCKDSSPALFSTIVVVFVGGGGDGGVIVV